MAAMAPGRNDFRVRFWGVRGSYPTTGPGTRDIGGDTACVEVNVGGQRLIFDAGTGIIPLGKEICRRAATAPLAYVFLSHTHIDHLLGLYFFAPLLTAGARSFIYGPGRSNGALWRTLQQLTHSNLFPVTFDELKGKTEVHSLAGGEVMRFSAPGARLTLRKPPPRGAMTMGNNYRSRRIRARRIRATASCSTASSTMVKRSSTPPMSKSSRAATPMSSSLPAAPTC